MKSNTYNIEKIIDSLYNKGYTNFIVPNDLKLIKGKLNKNEYKIYEPYKDCTKVILYKKKGDFKWKKTFIIHTNAKI